MKKVISIVAIIAGALALLSVAATTIIGSIFELSTPASVGVIGGADGPTVMMVAGTVGAGGVILAIAIGILLIATGIWGLKKIKK